MGKRVPSNADMIMERRGRFLIGEWKRPNEKVSLGQQILLKALAKVPKFTVLVIQGDTDDGMVVNRVWKVLPNEGFEIVARSVDDFKQYLKQWDEDGNA